MIYYIYCTSTSYAADRVGTCAYTPVWETDYFISSMGHSAGVWSYYHSAGWINTIIHFSANTWYKVELILDINADTCLNYLVNGTSLATSKAFKNTMTSWKCSLFYDYSTVMFIDDIFVRQYISAEPSHGAWGTEETTSALNAYTYNFSATLTQTISLYGWKALMRSVSANLIETTVTINQREKQIFIVETVTNPTLPYALKELSLQLTEVSSETLQVTCLRALIFMQSASVTERLSLSYGRELLARFFEFPEAVNPVEQMMFINPALPTRNLLMVGVLIGVMSVLIVTVFWGKEKF